MEVNVREQAEFDPETFKKSQITERSEKREQSVDLEDPRWGNLSKSQKSRLEELKRKCKTRSATYDEIIELLEDELLRLSELEKEKDSSDVCTDDSLPRKKHQYHDIQDIHEQRYVINKPQLQVTADSEAVSAPVVPPVSYLVEARSRKPLPAEPHIHLEATPLSARVLNEYHSVPVRTAAKPVTAAPAVLPPAPPPTLDAEMDQQIVLSLQHKVRQKRRTLEEVILYDVDTFYERRKLKEAKAEAKLKKKLQSGEQNNLDQTTAEQEGDIIPSPQTSPKSRRKKRKTRRINPKIVTYIVTTDESLNHRKLSNKDWTEFAAKQKSDTSEIIETSEYKVDSNVNESAPGDYNDGTLQIRGLKPAESSSEAVSGSTTPQQIPKVKDSLKKQRKKRGPKRMTYIVTYDSWPSRKGSPLPIRSTLRSNAQMKKYEGDIEIQETAPKSIYDIEKMMSSKKSHIVVTDSNANNTIPDFYVESEFDVDTGLAVDNKIETEMKISSVDYSIEMSAPVSTTSNIYTPPPEKQIRECIVQPPTPDTIKYVLLYKDAPQEQKYDIAALDETDVTTSDDYDNVSDIEVYRRVKHKIQEDMHFTVDYSSADETDHERKEQQTTVTFHESSVAPVSEKFQTQLETDIDAIMGLKETSIDFEAERIQEVSQPDRYEHFEVVPVQIEREVEPEIIHDDMPVIIETISPPEPAKRKAKEVTYVVQYKESHVVKPMGKYRRKLKKEKEVKVVALPPDIQVESSVLVPAQEAQILPETAEIKGKRRRVPKEVTFIVNHANPYVDLPTGKYSRSKKLASFKKPETAEDTEFSETAVVVARQETVSPLSSSAVETKVKKIKKRSGRTEPKVVSYIVNYGGKFIDIPTGKYARSKHVPRPQKLEKKVEEEPLQIEHAIFVATDDGKAEVKGNGRRRTPKVATFVVNYEKPYIDQPRGKYRRASKAFRPSLIDTTTIEQSIIEEPMAETAAQVQVQEFSPVVVKTTKTKTKKGRRTEPKIAEFIVNYENPYGDLPKGPYRSRLVKNESKRMQAVSRRKEESRVDEPVQSSVFVPQHGSPRSGKKKQPVIVQYVVDYDEPYVNRPTGKYRRKIRRPNSQWQTIEPRSNDQVAELTSADLEVSRTSYTTTESIPKVKGGRVRERKSEKDPKVVTYVVSYDIPIKQTDLVDDDSYTGGKIRNWNLKHKTTENDLPETVAPRAVIRSEDVREAEIKKSTPMQIFGLTANSGYEYSTADMPRTDYTVVKESYSKAYDPEVPRAPRVTAAVYSPDIQEISSDARFTDVQINSADSQSKASSGKGSPSVKQVKRKFSDARSSPQMSPKYHHNVTYVVSHSPPTKYRNWDIKSSRSGRAMHKKRSSFDEDVSLEFPPLNNERKRSERMPQPSFILQERSQEASRVIPESSSLEFPVCMPQDNKLSGPEPYVMTYQTNYDLPAKKKEWDIKVKKRRSTAVKQKPGRKAKLPQTMTYQVTHEPPRRHKEWDLKVSRGSYSLRKQKVIMDFDEPQVQLKTETTNIAEPVAAVSFDTTPVQIKRYSKSSLDERQVQRVDEYAEPEIHQREISIRNNGYNVREQFQTTAVLEPQVVLDYSSQSPRTKNGRQEIIYSNQGYMEQSFDNYYSEPIYESDVDNVPYTEPKTFHIDLESDYNWGQADIRRSYRSETPRGRSSSRIRNEYEVPTASNMTDVAIQYENISTESLHRNLVTRRSNASSQERLEYTVGSDGRDLTIEEPVMSETRYMEDTQVTIEPAYNTLPLVTDQGADKSLSTSFELESSPHCITYTVNYEQPQPRKEWDIKINKSGAVKSKPGSKTKAASVKAKPEKVAQSVTYHVTYDIVPKGKMLERQTRVNLNNEPEDTQVKQPLDRPRVEISAPKPQARDDVNVDIRTPPPEFQDNRPHLSYQSKSPSVEYDSDISPGVSGKKQPVSVTYHITYDLPKSRKEWDIKTKSVRKPFRKTLDIADAAAEEEVTATAASKTASAIKMPVTVTYKINYDLPQKRKEWDIKFGKQKSKPRPASKVTSYAPEQEVEQRSFEQTQQLMKSKAIKDEMIYQVNYQDVRPYKEWDISAKKSASRKHTVKTADSRKKKVKPVEAGHVVATEPLKQEDVSSSVTYVVNRDEPKTHKQWDIKVKKSKRDKFRKASPSNTISIDEQEYDIHQIHEQDSPTLHIPLTKPDVESPKAVTVTYVVNRDSPAVWKEWDIKSRKSKSRGKISGVESTKYVKTHDVAGHETDLKEPYAAADLKILIEQPTPVLEPDENIEDFSADITPVRHFVAVDEGLKYKESVHMKYDADFDEGVTSMPDDGPTLLREVETKQIPEISVSIESRQGQEEKYLETNIDDMLNNKSYIIQQPDAKIEMRQKERDVPQVAGFEIDYAQNEIEVSPNTQVQEPIDVKISTEDSQDFHTVSYTINYDDPVRYKEWDFKMRKSAAKNRVKTAQNKQEDITTGDDTDLKQKNAIIILPHTVTYKVNYGLPEKRSEWDIKLPKGKGKADKGRKGSQEPAVEPFPVEVVQPSVVAEKKEAVAPEPQSVTFCVKYNLPVAKSTKKAIRRSSQEPDVAAEVEQVADKKMEEEHKIKDDQLIVGVDEPTVESKDKDSVKSKQKSQKKPQTMTFIVKYEMPIAKQSPKASKPKQELKETEASPDINIAPMSEFQNDIPQEVIDVEIPAVEVIKIGRKDSADKLQETVTYVVNYQLPKAINKEEKKLKLKTDIIKPQTDEAEETPKIKKGDDVNAALQGTGTYFHVTQPSPEVITTVPALESAASNKKKIPEIQEATYTVTYDVTRDKKPRKRSAKGSKEKAVVAESKKSDDVPTKAAVFIVEDVLPDTSLHIEEPLPEVPAQIELVIDEPSVTVSKGDNIEIHVDSHQGLDDQTVHFGQVDNVDRNVYIGSAGAGMIAEVPEMFADIEHSEIKTVPVVKPIEAEKYKFHNSDAAVLTEIQDYFIEMLQDSGNIPSLEITSSIHPDEVVSEFVEPGEIVVNDVVTIDLRTDLLLQDVNTNVIIEPDSTNYVSDVTFSDDTKTPERLVNGHEEDYPAQVEIKINDASNVAVVEPSPPEERTVEVMKVLVPLIQSGTLHRSVSPPPSTKVTYIVKHDSNRTSMSPPPQDSQANYKSEEDLGVSCFGRQSFRKPVKFSESVSKATNKPVLAVPPSVRSKAENQCILIKLAGDDAVAEPPPAFEDNKPSARHFVVVAIDFGTAYSGYAFRFTRDTGESVHIMRQWEGGDPGALDYKTPSTLLLTPDGKFHSFGFTARNFFHDLNPEEAKRWMYFDKFKMALHFNADLNMDTEITASNGHRFSALQIFSMSLRFFRDHALQELSEQSSTRLVEDDIQWIITVPTIWKSPARQFMRRAAYQAGIASPENPTQLIISLEPEAASIAVRREKFQELIPEVPPRMTYMRTRRSLTPGRRSQTPGRRSQTPGRRSQTPERSRRHSEPRTVGRARQDLSTLNLMSGGMFPSEGLQVPGVESSIYADITVGQEVNVAGQRYMIVDCGGGTVDITVHEIQSNDGTLIEIHRATGGPHGSIGVDHEFEKLLVEIFSEEFIEMFKLRRPAGWVDLLMAFESRKRATDPSRPKPLNVSLPFSFTDYHKKIKGCTVDMMINKLAYKGVSWSSQGMLRLTHEAMERLFQPTLSKIVATVDEVVLNPKIEGIKCLFLVGGFAESAMLQTAVRKAFSHKLKVLIPYEVSLAILKGAVSFGCDPSVVTMRKSRLTYGVAIQAPYIKGQHPKSKLVTRDGAEWCMDVFDPLVLTDQPVYVGETVTRHYHLVDPNQTSTLTPGTSLLSEIAIYASDSRRIQFTTDSGVKKCGTLCLEMSAITGATSGKTSADTVSDDAAEKRKLEERDIQLAMTFGNTEITVAAIDTATGKCMRAAIDFLNK